VSAEDGTGQPVRQAWLQVESKGRHYVLSLASSLESVTEATAVYYRVAAGTLLVMVLLIWLSQSALAANLSGRIGVMMAHLPSLERGRLNETMPADATGDELSQLRVALNEATRQLARSRESEERFLANAAHELRTPLALLRTRLDLSLRKPRSEAELKTALEEARGDVERLANLATKLLEWSQPAAPCRSPLDLAPMLSAMIEAWRPLMSERALDLELKQPERCIARVDRMEIERAIANLLDNARKFAAAGSAIQVSMEQTDALTRVIVASRGVAIAPSEREHIFEPFVRGNVRQPGSGLGLALVRDAAQRHGGTAYVEVDGEVSRFVFELRD
jgi:signal transduction histidine kinase